VKLDRFDADGGPLALDLLPFALKLGKGDRPPLAVPPSHGQSRRPGT
jgi:hypothetical protein